MEKPLTIMQILHKLVPMKGSNIAGENRRSKLGWKPQASAIERFNLTDGQRNRHQPGKTLEVSKQNRFDDWISWTSVRWYNFHLKWRSHNDKNEEGVLIQRTPAMAAGIAPQPDSTLQLIPLLVLG